MRYNNRSENKKPTSRNSSLEVSIQRGQVKATLTRESGFELHHLVKTKTPKLVVTTHAPVTSSQEDKLFRSIDSFMEGVEREDWVSSPGLQCVSCEFFNECKGGVR